MTNAIEIQLADQIVARINGGVYDYSEDFTALRHFLPIFTVETSTLVVRVIPAMKTLVDTDRSGTTYEIIVHIGIQKRISGVTNAEIDPLMRLLEQIEDRLRGFNFGIDDFQVGYQGFDNAPLFDDMRLEMPREFAAMRAVRYWAQRDFDPVAGDPEDSENMRQGIIWISDTAPPIVESYVGFLFYHAGSYWKLDASTLTYKPFSGGAIESVFGRTDADIVAETGDYTAAQVGADPAGSAAAALTAAELYADAGDATTYTAAQVYSDAGDAAHLVAFAHGDIAHSNRTELDKVTVGDFDVSHLLAFAHDDIASNTTHRALVAGNPHVVTQTEIGLSVVTNDAQLKRAAGDFATFDVKASPVVGDVLLIEDSEDGTAKKYITISNLPAAAPAAHAPTHETLGSDEIDIAGLVGTAASPTLTLINSGTHNKQTQWKVDDTLDAVILTATVGRPASNPIGVNVDNVSLTTITDVTEYDFEKTDVFSVESWIYGKTDNGFHSTPLIQKIDGLPGWFLVLVSGGSADQLGVGFYMRDSVPNTYFFRTFDAIYDSENQGWNHVIVTHDGAGNFRLYVNAVEKAAVESGSFAGLGDIRNNDPLRIDGSGSGWADPGLDEMIIWNKELSPAEVTARYNAGSGLYKEDDANSIGIWHFDNGLSDESDVGANFSVNTGTPTYIPGIVSAPTADVQSELIRSIDGVLAGEEGIHNFGAETGRLNLRGQTVRVVIDGLEEYILPLADGSANEIIYTDGSGNLAFASNIADIALNTTHRGSDGSDHAFIDQSVVITASPTFANLIITAGGHIRPTANTTTALNIANAAGTPFIKWDTINLRMGIGVTPACAFHLFNQLAAPDDLGDWDNYQMVITGSSTTGTATGILLSSSVDTYGGSAILHYDTGSGGIGDLKLFTKRATTAVPPVESMSLTSTGDIRVCENGGELYVNHPSGGTKVSVGVDAHGDGITIRQTADVAGTYFWWYDHDGKAVSMTSFDDNWTDAALAGTFMFGARDGKDIVFSTATGASLDANSPKFRLMNDGKAGFMTSDPGSQVDINSTTGDCLTLIHNDADGSPATYVKHEVSSIGVYTVTPVGSANGFVITSSYLKLTAGQDIRPSADSTTALNLANAAGTAILTVDTTNSRVGVNTIPEVTLHIKEATPSELAFEATGFTTKGYFSHGANATGGTTQFSVNRRINGIFSNTSAASSAMNFHADNGNSYIKFYTSLTNNTTPIERVNIDGNGVVWFEGPTSNQLSLGTTTNYYKIGRSTSTGFLDFQGNQAGYTGYNFKNDNGTTVFTILDNYKAGFNTTAPGSQVDINSSTGDCLTLIHNDADGSPAVYVNHSISAAGVNTIAPVNSGSPGSILVPTTTHFNFRDSAIGIYSAADTYLDLYADGGTRIGNLAGTTYVNISAGGDLIFVGAGSGLSYGCLDGTAVDVACAVQNTYYQVTFDTEGPSNNTTYPVALTDIIINSTGDYLVSITACFHSANSQDWELLLQKNGGTVPLTLHLFQTTAVADKVENTAGNCLIPLTAGDTVEVWVRCTSAANRTAEFDHVSMNCVQVGGGA